MGRAIHEVIREARRRQGITQTELAREVKCKQPAISMFEGGRTDALSRKTVDLIAQRLGVDISGADGKAVAAAPGAGRSRKYCPVPDCPSNVPYVAGGALCLMPTIVMAPVDEKSRCGYCGEVMEGQCPDPECGAPLREGAFCARCGSRYVTAPELGDGDAEQWAEQRRAVIRQLRQLMSLAGN
jgi:DNA-binding XRE family transcriptional regulator